MRKKYVQEQLKSEAVKSAKLLLVMPATNAAHEWSFSAKNTFMKPFSDTPELGIG